MRDTLGVRLFNIFNNLFMILLMMVTLYPFLHVLFASLSKSGAYMAHQGLLLHPLGLNFAAYRVVFQNAQILTGFLNTLYILAIKGSMSIILTIIGAYCMSRSKQKAVLIPYFTMMIIFTNYFNGGLIPTYLNVKDLGLLDTRWALILPTLISTYNLIVMRTAFFGVPAELEESATLDGAGHLRILFKILVPLIKPTIAVVALYYFVGIWNSWFDAMIYLRNNKLFPLQLVLRDILIRNSTGTAGAVSGGVDTDNLSETIQFATMMVATIPILLVYPFLQKHFTKGIMVGAVKG